MDKIMDKLANLIVYIGNLLIHSKTHENHLVTLDEVLLRLTDNNMKLILAKCHLGNTEVSYLGFRLTPEGITPVRTNLKQWKKQKYQKQRNKSILLWDYAISSGHTYRILLKFVHHSTRQQEKTHTTNLD